MCVSAFGLQVMLQVAELHKGSESQRGREFDVIVVPHHFPPSIHFRKMLIINNKLQTFLKKSFIFHHVLDILVIEGQLALNNPKRASHNSLWISHS